MFLVVKQRSWFQHCNTETLYIDETKHKCEVIYVYSNKPLKLCDARNVPMFKRFILIIHTALYLGKAFGEMKL